MAKPKGKRKATSIAKCYNDVSVEDLIGIKKHTPRQVIRALSGLTAEEVGALTTEEVLALYEIVSFIDELSEIADALPPNYDPPKVDVAGGTFGQAERAKAKALEGKAPYKLFLDLVEIYFGEGYLSGPAAPALALGAMIYQDLNELLNRFKDLSSEKPTDEEEEAGVDALHTFGTYGICESIAAKYHARPYDIYNWTAEEVYLELTYQLAKSRYQENLRSIEERKSQGPKK